MSEDTKLTDRQQRVIPYLLTSPSTEEACRRARINKTTVYEWLRNETFREELKRQRDAVVERALDSLKANITKATKTLVKHLDSKRENISIRAAEDIIEFTQKAVEHEELEKRIEALEARLSQPMEKGDRNELQTKN
jgi:Transposase